MNLHFHAYGAGDPVLILHGLFGSADNWQTAAKMLAADFRVFALDLRNHGHSAHAPQMNYPIMAADIVDFLDAQGLPRAHVIGHSMGGKVAMQLALTSPGRVQRVVIVDIAPRAYPQLHREILAALQAIDLEALRDRRQADLELAASVPDLATRQFLLKGLARQPDGSFKWRFNLDAIAANYDRLNGPVPAGGRFADPILFLRGQNSNYVRPEDWPVIRERFPEAREAVVPGAGHWVHAEAPAAFHQIAAAFLKSLAAPGESLNAARSEH